MKKIFRSVYFIVILIFVMLFWAISCDRQKLENKPIELSTEPEDIISKESEPIEMPSPTNINVEIAEEAIVQDVNNVKIERFKFEPSEITIKHGTEVTWQNDDSKFHMVACYIKEGGGSIRVFRSDRIEQGKNYAFTFNSVGEYYCVDAIFGQRMLVHVKYPENKMTGNVILESYFDPINALMILAILSIILVVFVSYKYSK